MRLSLVPHLAGLLCVVAGGSALAEEATSQPAATESVLLRMRRDLDAQAASIDEQKVRIAELEAQREEDLASADVQPVERPRIRLSGFLDTGLQWSRGQAEDSVAEGFFQSTKPTFVLGNFNLYLDAQVDDVWSAFAEVRFTNLPNGADTPGSPFTPYVRQSTAVFDVTSASGGWQQVRWGAIILERAYIQWDRYQKLSLRVGQFLTPFGIWNVDHGTPTLIALALPQFVALELFPARQVGVEVFGSAPAGGWLLGYSATVSNGRTTGQLDPTTGKMLGGRLFARRVVPTAMTFGTSFVTGRFVDQHRALTFSPLGSRRWQVSSFEETLLGVDASIDAGAWRLRSEVLLRWLTIDEAPPPNFIIGAFETSLAYDGYLLAAYQLPWAGLEPFAYLEYLHFPINAGDDVLFPSLGMNVHFTTAVKLKVQYTFAAIGDLETFDFEEAWQTHLLATRLVIAL